MKIKVLMMLKNYLPRMNERRIIIRRIQIVVERKLNDGLRL
jgi:hypothetical protein